MWTVRKLYPGNLPQSQDYSTPESGYKCNNEGGQQIVHEGERGGIKPWKIYHLKDK